MAVNTVAWGVWFLVCVHITTPINILVNYAIYRLPNLKYRSAMRIMLSLSLVELGQLLNSVIAAFRLLIGYEAGPKMTIVFSFINNGFWCITVFNHVLLVVDRLYAVFNVTRVQHDHPGKWRVDPSIVFIWVAGFVQTTIWHFTGAYVFFDVSQMRWNPMTEIVPHPITNMLFAVLNISVCAFGVLGTGVIFALIYYKRHYGEAKTLPRRLEYRILIQNTFIFGCAVTSMFTSVLLPFVNETIRTNILNVILICASPYLYILLNRDIRRSFISIFSKQYAESLSNSKRITDPNIKTITLNTSSVVNAQNFRGGPQIVPIMA